MNFRQNCYYIIIDRVEGNRVRNVPYRSNFRRRRHLGVLSGNRFIIGFEQRMLSSLT